jgi:hypothetical protein
VAVCRGFRTKIGKEQGARMQAFASMLAEALTEVLQGEEG